MNALEMGGLFAPISKGNGVKKQSSREKLLKSAKEIDAMNPQQFRGILDAKCKEIVERLKQRQKDGTQDDDVRIPIGGSSLTTKEWTHLMKSIDEAEEAIRKAVKEEGEKNQKEALKEKKLSLKKLELAENEVAREKESML